MKVAGAGAASWRDPESGDAWRTQPSPPRQVIRSDLPTPQSPSEADGVDFKSIHKGTGWGSPSSPVLSFAPRAPTDLTCIGASRVLPEPAA